ncbi:transmembrane protein 231-like [Xenia sp. Carnegie-2017]|uniref:transmembrane protein 231-like n=1 Tax=Xenia sp. Carnegie-2017 TaxID=2897299 RepID=UPI001F036A10|nr:transmembrane protein 231-like [Xenia sp. Carnegie-2017]
MVMYVIHSHPVIQRYKAHICSKASVFQLILLLFTAFFPLLIAFASKGFWLKESSYKEQPEVHFKHEFIVLLQGLTSRSYVAYSTYQKFNNLVNDKLRIPVVKSFEEDKNRDGKNDVLNFTLEMPLTDKESAYGVQLLLVFEYKLQRFSTLVMESMAYIHHSSGAPGAEFVTIGELRLKQKSLLRHSGRSTTYNTTVIDSTSTFAEAYDFTNIFRQYFIRNVTTEYESVYPLWRTGRNIEAPFVLKATIYYPEERIFYRPGFWQLIKYAWIQYLAILVVLTSFFSRFKRFVFENQVVTTVPQKIKTEHED